MLLKSQEVSTASLDLSNKGWKMYIGALNENTPICGRGTKIVAANYDWILINPIIDSYAIKFNLFAEIHV